MKRPKLVMTPVERATVHDAARAEALRIIARRLARRMVAGLDAEGPEGPEGAEESGVRKVGS